MHIEMELRNLPRFRIMEYLEEAGGEPDGDLSVKGVRWSASLEEMEPAYVGMIRVPRDKLIIRGEEEIVRQVHALMRRKTMRGGG